MRVASCFPNCPSPPPPSYPLPAPPSPCVYNTGTLPSSTPTGWAAKCSRVARFPLFLIVCRYSVPPPLFPCSHTHAVYLFVVAVLFTLIAAFFTIAQLTAHQATCTFWSLAGGMHSQHYCTRGLISFCFRCTLAGSKGTSYNRRSPPPAPAVACDNRSRWSFFCCVCVCVCFCVVALVSLSQSLWEVMSPVYPYRWFLRLPLSHTPSIATTPPRTNHCDNQSSLAISCFHTILYPLAAAIAGSL